MKSFCTIVFLIISITTFSQKKYEFLGIDFNKARFIGSAGFNDPSKIQSVYLNAWNDVLITEKEKYDLNKFYKKEFRYNFDFVKNLNKHVNVESKIINEDYEFSKEEAKAYVKSSYTGSGTNYGVLYLVEFFDKRYEVGSIYVILLDMASGDVKYIERFYGNAVGFGFKNYWLGAIYKIMKVSSWEIKREKW